MESCSKRVPVLAGGQIVNSAPISTELHITLYIERPGRLLTKCRRAGAVGLAERLLDIPPA